MSSISEKSKYFFSHSNMMKKNTSDGAEPITENSLRAGENNSKPKEVTRYFYSPEMQAEITIIGTKRYVNSVSVGVVGVDEDTGENYYDILKPTGWIDIYADSSNGDCPGDIDFEPNKKARTAGIENAEDVISYASKYGIPYTEAFNMFSKTKYERILVVMWQDNSTGMHGTYIFGKEAKA